MELEIGLQVRQLAGPYNPGRIWRVLDCDPGLPSVRIELLSEDVSTLPPGRQASVVNRIAEVPRSWFAQGSVVIHRRPSATPPRGDGPQRVLIASGESQMIEQSWDDAHAADVIAWCAEQCAQMENLTTEPVHLLWWSSLDADDPDMTAEYVDEDLIWQEA